MDGALITDLPVEESDEYLARCAKRGLATVFLAAPTSTDERLQRSPKRRVDLYMRSREPA